MRKDERAHAKPPRRKDARTRRGGGALVACEVESVESGGRKSVDLKHLGLHFYSLHLALFCLCYKEVTHTLEEQPVTDDGHVPIASRTTFIC